MAMKVREQAVAGKQVAQDIADCKEAIKVCKTVRILCVFLFFSPPASASNSIPLFHYSLFIINKKNPNYAINHLQRAFVVKSKTSRARPKKARLWSRKYVRWATLTQTLNMSGGPIHISIAHTIFQLCFTSE